MTSRRKARDSPAADSSREPAGQTAAWQSGGGTIVDQTDDVPAVAGSRYARTWHNQTLFTKLRSRGRPAGDHPPFRPGRAAGRLARDAADRRTVFPGTPGGQAFPPRSEPRQQPRSSAGPGLGRTLQRRRTFASSRTRDLTTCGSRSPGTTTRVPDLHFGSSPRSSPGSMSWSMPDCAKSSASSSTFTTSTISPPIPRHRPRQFEAIWAQLADHYARSPEGLAFELLNEPKDAATTEVVNPIFAEDDRAHSPDQPQPNDLRRARPVEQHQRASGPAPARRRRKPDRDRAQLRAVFLHPPGCHLVRSRHES